jgi:hypothetical protein
MRWPSLLIMNKNKMKGGARMMAMDSIPVSLAVVPASAITKRLKKLGIWRDVGKTDRPKTAEIYTAYFQYVQNIDTKAGQEAEMAMVLPVSDPTVFQRVCVTTNTARPEDDNRYSSMLALFNEAKVSTDQIYFCIEGMRFASSMTIKGALYQAVFLEYAARALWLTPPMIEKFGAEFGLSSSKVRHTRLFLLPTCPRV